MSTNKKRRAKENEGPRIVTVDIETAPLKVWCWGLFDQNMGLEQIASDWSILSFSAKVLGEKDVLYMDTGGRGASKVQDDKRIIQALWKVLDEADIVVTQNGISFDLKKIRARMIMMGMPPFRPVKMIDTMVECKKNFAMTSNKLAYTSRVLTDTPKSEHKEFPGFELWSECLKDNKKAWAEMKKYNVKDVEATEKLYLKLRPWIEGHPNVAAYYSSEEAMCPKCGSDHLEKRGFSCSQTQTYQRYVCKECGGWSRGRLTMSTKSKRGSMLVN